MRWPWRKAREAVGRMWFTGPWTWTSRLICDYCKTEIVVRTVGEHSEWSALEYLPKKCLTCEAPWKHSHANYRGEGSRVRWNEFL